MGLAPLRLLGRFFLAAETVIEVRWCRETRKIHIARGADQWLCGDRESIAHTIAMILEVSPSSLQILNLVTFYNFDFSEGRPADAELLYHFMKCDWTDYALDHLCFHGVLLTA